MIGAILHDLSIDHEDRIRTGDLHQEVIIVADMFYEASVSRRALNALSDAAARGSDIIIADGGRTFAPRELDILWQGATAVQADVEGVEERQVRIGRWRGSISDR